MRRVTRPAILSSATPYSQRGSTGMRVSACPCGVVSLCDIHHRSNGASDGTGGQPARRDERTDEAARSGDGRTRSPDRDRRPEPRPSSGREGRGIHVAAETRRRRGAGEQPRRSRRLGRARPDSRADPVRHAAALAQVVVRRGDATSRPARFFVTPIAPSIRSADDSGVGPAAAARDGSAVRLSAPGSA